MHTPGPWRQSKGELGYETFDILADGGDIYVHNLGIATVVDPRFSDPDLGTVALDRETCNANARLIAAAPELLEACKEIDAIGADVPWNTASVNFVLNKLMQCREIARAANEKAWQEWGALRDWAILYPELAYQATDASDQALTEGRPG